MMWTGGKQVDEKDALRAIDAALDLAAKHAGYANAFAKRAHAAEALLKDIRHHGYVDDMMILSIDAVLEEAEKIANRVEIPRPD
jgi:hypothetical protein